MDVLITMTQTPQVEGSDISVWFLSTCREADGTVHQLPFRVPMTWGGGGMNKIAIANTARDDIRSFFLAHGRNMPTINRIEVIGV